MAVLVASGCGDSMDLDGSIDAGPDAPMVPDSAPSDATDVAPAVVELLAFAEEAVVAQLDHTAGQTRVHGHLHAPIQVGATRLEPQRDFDYFAFELGPSELVWGAVAGAPGERGEEYWFANRIRAESHARLRVYGQSDGSASWGETAIPPGAFAASIGRDGSLDLVAIELGNELRVTSTRDLIVIGARIEPGTTLDAGGASLTAPAGGAHLLVAAFDAAGAHRWHHWMPARDALRMMEASDDRIYVALDVPAGADVLGATAPEGEYVVAMASFSETGQVDVGFVPQLVSLTESVITSDGGIVLTGAAAPVASGGTCLATRLAPDMTPQWEQFMPYERDCRIDDTPAGIVVTGFTYSPIPSEGGAFGDVVRLLDRATGEPQWSRVFEGRTPGSNDVAIDSTGWWLAANLEEGDGIRISDDSFDASDEGMVVYARFDHAGELRFTSLFDLPGRQLSSLHQLVAQVPQHVSSGETLYTIAQTSRSSRIDQTMLVEVSESTIRRAAIELDAAHSCTFFGASVATCPMALDGDRVLVWLGWVDGELVVDDTTLVAPADQRLAAGALLSVRFAD